MPLGDAATNVNTLRDGAPFRERGSFREEAEVGKNRRTQQFHHRQSHYPVDLGASR